MLKGKIRKTGWFSVIPFRKQISTLHPPTFPASVSQQNYTVLDQLKFWPIYSSGVNPNFHHWKWDQIHFVFNKAVDDKQVSSLSDSAWERKFFVVLNDVQGSLENKARIS